MEHILRQVPTVVFWLRAAAYVWHKISAWLSELLTVLLQPLDDMVTALTRVTYVLSVLLVIAGLIFLGTRRFSRIS